MSSLLSQNVHLPESHTTFLPTIHLEHIVNDLLQRRYPSLGLRGGKGLLTQLCADGSHGLLIVGAVDRVHII